MRYSHNKIRLHLALLIATILAAPIQRAIAHRNYSQVGILVEYYEVDLSALPAMLRDYQNAPDASGLLTKVQKLAEAGDARLAESSYIAATSGIRAKIESVRELIYPAEFAPPDIPKVLTGPIDPEVLIKTPATATAFTARYVGHTVEVEPSVLASGDAVQLAIMPALFSFHGFKHWGREPSPFRQPQFDLAKTSTSITVKFNSCELFGVFSPTHTDKSKRLLGFVSPNYLAAMSRKAFEAQKTAPKEAREPAAKTAAETDDDPFSGDGDADAAPPRQISIITEYIEVDAALASRIARELHTISDATAIRHRLDALIAEKKARLLDTSVALTLPGVRTKSQAVREYIYPASFGPAESPATLKGPIEAGVDVITSTSPSAFHARSLGISVEVEPNILPPSVLVAEPEAIIELNIAPEVVGLAGESSYGSGPSTTKQPLFETTKLTTNVKIPDGTSLLLGMHGLETARAGKSGSDAEKNAVRDRRVLVFVTAKVKQLE